MKKKTNVMILSAALAFAATGCGPNYSGTYNGTQTIQITGSQAQASPVSIQLTQSGSDSVSGSWSSSIGNGTLVGRVDNNSLSQVTLTITPTTSSNLTSGTNGTNGMPTYNPLSQAGCSGTFTGSLVASGNMISGTLNTLVSTYCSGTITINATK